MSGMRDHKIFTVTIVGQRTYFNQDTFGDNYGPKLRRPHTETQVIVASMPEIALAHVNKWIPFCSWAMDPPPTVTIDAGVCPDVVIIEQVW